MCKLDFSKLRDEFAWHSKSVHNDILGGMNNWLEHRCPLAVYGCGFSHRRMYPGRKEANQTLIFRLGSCHFDRSPNDEFSVEF